jgi:hypothetical protein
MHTINDTIVEELFEETMVSICFKLLQLTFMYNLYYIEKKVALSNTRTPVNVVYTVPTTHQLQQSYPAITQTRSTTIYATPNQRVSGRSLHFDLLTMAHSFDHSLLELC